MSLWFGVCGWLLNGIGFKSLLAGKQHFGNNYQEQT
jgi:hypothetical protein